MKKISIVCVTNRKDSIPFLMEQLNKQTFQDFEVIIADDANQERHPGVFHFKPRQKNEGDVWNLNKAYNDALNLVTGELTVFLQDFIWIPANGLERFWEVYQTFPNDLVTGVGHKYLEDLTTLVESDSRAMGEKTIYESNPTFYELNWSSCPTKHLVEFDEEMDKNYGGENIIFAVKTKQKVWIDRFNECKGIVHTDRPSDWEEKHSNKGSFLKILDKYDY